MSELSPLLHAYAKREYLSVSTLMDFVRCPRRYFFKKSGLASHDEGGAMLYGTAMHKAVPACLTEGLDAGIVAFRSVWDGNEDKGDDKRNLKRAIAQLTHYHHSHIQGRSLYSFEKPPPGCVVLDETTSPLEVPAILDVGLPIPLVVRIDGLVRHRDTGELWGWEFKTSGRMNASLFDNMEMAPQVLTYTMVLRTLTGADVRGMMVEGMLIDKTKVDNITQPITVQDHLLEDIHGWLRYWGELLLACEKRALEVGPDFAAQAKSFIKNFAGCSAYPQYYLPSYMCEFNILCRQENFSNLLPLFAVKPDHKFVTLTKEGN